MTRYLLRPTLASLLLVASLTLSACSDTQFEPAAEITLQTRSATEVLPANSHFAGMIDLQAMQQNSPFNPLYDGMTENISGEVGARIQDFIDATGFDPITDLREIYVAADGQGAEGRPNIVAYANFDRARLQAYVETNAPTGFERTDYNGVPVYRADRNGNGFSFALANNNMIVAAADPADVEAMLDRLTGKGVSLDDNPEMMRLIERAASGTSAWFVVQNIRDDPFQHAERSDVMDKNAAQIGRAVQDAVVTINMQAEGVDGLVYLYTKQEVSSADLADLTRGLVSAMKSAPEMDADKLRALDRVRVKDHNDHVRIRFEVDYAALQSGR